MADFKKPVFNPDAAEEYFSMLLTSYRDTANDIFRRDNEGRHASEQHYSAEYQKYLGMQIALREVLEYFGKYDLADWISVKDKLPESGVHVLLCCEMHRYGGGIAGKYVCDGYYAEANKISAGGFPDDCDCEYSEEDDEYYLREGWYEVIKNWDDYNSVTVGDFVTHWKPLPEPPEEVQNGTE